MTASSRLTPEQRQEFAREFITACRAAGIGCDLDPNLWLASIVGHLEPLPDNRPWLVHTRRRTTAPVSILARAVAHRLTPEPGHQPQPTCPNVCLATHIDDADVA